MNFFILIAVYVCVILFDFIPVCKSRQKKNIAVYSVLFGTAFVATFLHLMKIDVPNPSVLIKFTLQDILHLK